MSIKQRLNRLYRLLVGNRVSGWYRVLTATEDILCKLDANHVKADEGILQRMAEDAAVHGDAGRVLADILASECQG